MIFPKTLFTLTIELFPGLFRSSRPIPSHYCCASSGATSCSEAIHASAMPAFAALVGLHADDPLAGFHLRRLLNGAKGIRMQLE